MNYRKIWESHTGLKIPKGYHIHHIDGNHQNNDPSNLCCVSPDEHWQIHYDRGDIIAINGKFIQGASKAGKIGGSKNKGKIRSDEFKLKMSETLKRDYAIGKRKSRKGMKDDQKTIMKKRLAACGEKNGMFGKSHSEKTKRRLSDVGKELIGEKNPFYNKQHNETSKHLMSMARFAYHKSIMWDVYHLDGRIETVQDLAGYLGCEIAKRRITRWSKIHTDITDFHPTYHMRIIKHV